MANPWFRMYAEFANDAKVQMLSESMQRRYIMLMCLRCSNSLVTLQDEEVAFQLRISNEELAETKDLFIGKGFIDSSWNLLNWEKRQFLSDSSNDRVKRHRAKRAAQGLPQQNSISTKTRLSVFSRDNCTCIYCGSEEDLTIDHKTPQSRGGTDEIENLATACRACNASKRDLTSEEFTSRKDSNVTVTPHIQKQITDTDKKNTPLPPNGGDVLFAKFWSAYPRKVGKDVARKAFDKRKPSIELVDLMVQAVNRQKMTQQWAKDGGQFIPHPSTWINEGRWMDGEQPGQPDSTWFREAGFDFDWVANNAGCYPSNFKKFANGKRLEAA
jgi:5-methylcytosine-specific restriction endonuclease McrA